MLISIFIMVLTLVGLITLYKFPTLGMGILIFVVPFISFFQMLAITVLALAVILLKKIIIKDYKFEFSSIYIYAIMYALICIVQAVLSYNFSESITNFIIMIFSMSFIFFIPYIAKTKSETISLITLIILSNFSLAAFSIYQYLFLGTTDKSWVDPKLNPDIDIRVFGTMENPNNLSQFFVLTIPIIVAFIIYKKSYIQKVLLSGCLAIVFVALFLTYSRASYIAIIVSALVFIAMYNKKYLLYLFMVAPLGIFMLPDKVISRFSTIGDLKDTSASYRVEIWKNTIKLIKENLVSGIGYGSDNYHKLYLLLQDYKKIAYHSHNLFLQNFVELGIIGFIIFLIMILVILFEMFKSYTNTGNYVKILSIGFISSFTGVLVNGMFEYSFFYWKNLIMFFMIIGIFIAIKNLKIERDV